MFPMVRAWAGSSEVIPLLSLYLNTVLPECESFCETDAKNKMSKRKVACARMAANICLPRATCLFISIFEANDPKRNKGAFR